MKRRLALITALLTSVWCASANAQFGDLLKKAKGKTQATVEKKPETTTETKTTTTTKTTQTTTTTGGAEVNGQPDLTAAKIDFVPGERTVFFDDFSDMAPDEPPPHWKLRGGRAELKTGGNIHELAPGQGAVLISPSIPVPKNFTLESVITGQGEVDWNLRDKDNHDVLRAEVTPAPSGQKASVHVWAGEDLGRGEITTKPADPLTFDLWVQEGRLRAYLNGERLVDVNQVNLKPIDHIEMHPSRYRLNGLREVRVAESMPDFSKVFASSGKYVTHGIHFATDSDRIEPDSAGVIRMIAGALEKNPALKLEIDGYTDSVGSAAHNQELSKRRAEAVKSVLVSQFNIEPSRLTPNGLGAAKPIASNDTAEGRASNRRVEFVRAQ